MSETIGQQLKHAREAKHLTIQKVVQATYIRAYHLEAMEADDFETLPSAVQGRAFIRLYAEFLGISLDGIIDHQRASIEDPLAATATCSPGSKLQDMSVAENSNISSIHETKPVEGKLEKVVARLRKIDLRKKTASLLTEPAHQPSEAATSNVPPIMEQANPSIPGTRPFPTESLFGNNRPGGFLAHLKHGVSHPNEPSAQMEPVEETGLLEPLSSDRAAQISPPEESAALITKGISSKEIFRTIGKNLNQRRESLSLTLDEIERHTHVRTHYLKALETGAFDHLPSSVQARGMLNNYASFLDLDVDELLLRFAEGLQAQRLERQQREIESISNVAAKSPFNPRQPFNIKIPAVLQRYFSVDIFVGGGLVLLLLIFAIWGTSRILNLRAGSTPQPTAPSILNILVTTPEEITTTPTPTTIGNVSSIVAPVAGETQVLTLPAAGTGSVQVVLVAQDQAWVRVTVDGKLQFAGRVTAGTAYSYDGNTQIEVLTGNGRAISILYNQNNLGPMGNIGEVVDHIYTADAILNPTATFTQTPTITPTPTITLRPSTTPRPSATPRISPTQGQ
jgi:cytoskeleton protein RodZ